MEQKLLIFAAILAGAMTPSITEVLHVHSEKPGQRKLLYAWFILLIALIVLGTEEIIK
jgi:hypothetical protein